MRTSGQLRTKASLDHEAKSAHSVIVRATDSSGAAADTSVIISVANKEEPGGITFSPSTPATNRRFTATVIDPDGALSVSRWLWERSTDLSSWAAIPGAASGFYTPVAEDKGNYLRVTAHYDDGEGSGKQVAVVTVKPVSSAPPPTIRRGGGSGAGGGGSGGGEAGEGQEQRVPTASDIFDDLAAGIWYETAVTWMIQHDITRGCAPKMFCPKNNLTRQQFVTFLWRAAGRPTPTYSGSQAFADVPEGVYSDQAIGWAVSKGVTVGCTEGDFGDPDWKFCPDQPVTRAQMAVLLYRHLEADYIGQITVFTDVSSDSYYAQAVAWMRDFQIISGGCAPKLFCPDRPATRAEAAGFISGVAIRPHTWGTGNTSFIPQ